MKVTRQIISGKRFFWKDVYTQGGGGIDGPSEERSKSGFVALGFEFNVQIL